MKVILEEDIPRELTWRFREGGHEVAHVEDLGWKGITNGELQLGPGPEEPLTYTFPPEY